MEIYDQEYIANLYAAFNVYAATPETSSATPSTPPLPRREIDVRFSFTLNGETGFEQKTVRLNIEEPDDDELGDYIYDRIVGSLLPIENIYEIAGEILRKVRLLACDLQVDIELDSEAEEDDDDDDDCETVVEISSLKRKRIDEDEEGEEDCCCVICLEQLTAGTEVPMLSCGHFCFHDHCISMWLAKCPSCPLCRHKMMLSESYR